MQISNSNASSEVFQIENQVPFTVENATWITPALFGGNTLISETDITDQSSDFQESIVELGVSSLRYPGGSVTEWYFDINNPNRSSLIHHGNSVELVPFHTFLDEAATLNSSVTLVIPTRTGLSASAEEALLDGTFGKRSIDLTYVSDVTDFVIEALSDASIRGVTIEAFEIGNEFWGSGEMTASEYGLLAAHLTVAIEDALLGIGMSRQEQPNILIQGTAATGTYSPTPFQPVFLNVYELSNGELWSDLNNYGVGDAPPELNGLTVVVDHGPIQVPSQPWVFAQNTQIINALTSVQGALDAMDGWVLHYYGDEQIQNIDTNPERIFEVFDFLNETNEARSSSLPSLLNYLTEWNIRAPLTHPNVGEGGILHASYLVEMFYKMVTSGVDGAHAWPLRNSGSQLSSHLDVDGEGLSLAGSAFQLLSNNLVGATPIFDYEHRNTSGHIDTHGFSNDDGLVVFVSERGGETSTQIIDLSAFLAGHSFLYSVQTLSATGSPGNPNSEPLLYHLGTQSAAGMSTIELDMSAYSLSMVKLTYLNSEQNTIQLTDQDDRVVGAAGHDEFWGLNGNDTIHGESGDDTLYGDNGDDELAGGMGDDTLQGDHGADTLLGLDGNDLLLADFDDVFVDGGLGIDTVSFAFAKSGAQFIFDGGVSVDLLDSSIEVHNIELLIGSSFTDTFSVYSSQSNSFSGGAGDDWFTSWLGVGNSFFGDSGSDSFYIYGGESCSFSGGNGDDFFFSSFGVGNEFYGDGGDDVFIAFNQESDSFIFNMGDGSDRIKGFESGVDLIFIHNEEPSDIDIVETNGGTMIFYDDQSQIFLDSTFDIVIGEDIFLL